MVKRTPWLKMVSATNSFSKNESSVSNNWKTLYAQAGTSNPKLARPTADNAFHL